MIPDRLEAAVAAHHAKLPPRHHARATGAVGELAVAQGSERRRVVLVTAIDEVSRTASINLATNRTDMATDLDALLRRGTSGAPYDIAAQGELYGPIYTEQLDDLIGEAPSDFAKAVASALATDGETLDDRETGLPLGGSDDPRRAFKEDELSDLMDLVSACRRWVNGGSAEIKALDPDVLFPPPVGTPFEEGLDRLDRLLDLLDSFEKEGHKLSLDLAAMLEDAAFEEIRRWHTEFGMDIWSRLERMAQVERITVTQTVSRSELRRSYVSSHAEAGTLSVDLATVDPTSEHTTIVAESGADPSKSCRARLVPIGGSR